MVIVSFKIIYLIFNKVKYSFKMKAKIVVTGGCGYIGSHTEIVGRREGDVPQLFAATDLAYQKMGWKAELGLDEMIDSAWCWEQKYRNHNTSK